MSLVGRLYKHLYYQYSHQDYHSLEFEIVPFHWKEAVDYYLCFGLDYDEVVENADDYDA